MILQTRTKRAMGAPKAWSKQYENNHNPDKIAITERLNALTPAERTADTIDRIIGNDSWTRLECDCCEAIVERGVCATELSGCSSLLICADCLNDANKIIADKEPTP